MGLHVVSSVARGRGCLALRECPIAADGLAFSWDAIQEEPKLE